MDSQSSLESLQENYTARLNVLRSTPAKFTDNYTSELDNRISAMKSSGNGSDKAIVPEKKSFANVLNGINTKRPTPKGLEQVLEQGPWLIRNIPLILTKWSPNMSLTKYVVTRVLVWVKLHKVLVHGVEFARALIDVSADKELKQEVIMAIPRGEDENEGHTIEKIRVENKFKPPVCLDCHVFGHTADQCPKKVHDKPMPDVAINDNGFTMVVNR
ncbi:trichome birefringence-like protein 3, partial [Tanacetum coccineum]